MQTLPEAIVLTLGATFLLAVVGLWLSVRSGSTTKRVISFLIGVSGSAFFWGTFIYLAIPRITRPPESESLALAELKIERLNNEVRSLSDRLTIASRADQLVREAHARAEGEKTAADRARAIQREETARRATIESAQNEEKARAATLESTITGLRQQLSEARQSLVQSAATVTQHKEALSALNLKLNGAYWNLTRCQSSKLLITASAQRAQQRARSQEKSMEILKVALAEAVKATCVPQEQAPPAATARSDRSDPAPIMKALEGARSTPFYSILRATTPLAMAGRDGTYFSITLRPNNSEREFQLEGLEPAISPSSDLFDQAVDQLVTDIMGQFGTLSSIELLVRGAADTRPIRNQPDAAKLGAVLAFDGYERLAKDRYGADRAPKRISLPLDNMDLPNLRASLVAGRLRSRLLSRGLSVPVSVLEEVPQGSPRPIAPEILLYVPHAN